jgi:putative spermidine/putrescine transport system substrate-binding protein
VKAGFRPAPDTHLSTEEEVMAQKWTRRQFNTALAASAALAATGVPHARAAQGPVVVGTWGGDYQNLMQKYIADPLLTPKGVDVVWDTANDTVRKTKLMAEKRLPRGSMDVVALTASGSYEMWKNGTLEDIDASKIPNIAHVLPKLRTKYSVPHIYTGRVILYNPTKIRTKPTSYADLWNPELAALTITSPARRSSSSSRKWASRSIRPTKPWRRR